MSASNAPDTLQQGIAYLGIGLVALLLGTAAAAVLGVPWAWQATGTIVMLTAVVLGVREAASRRSIVQIGAAALLLFGGTYGVFVGVGGGDPFQDWSALGPVAIGVALTFFIDDPASRQN